MDVAFLCRVLEGTLSPDNKMRKAAEGRLHAMVSSPGYIVTLLQLIQAPDMPVAGKSAAALALKNAVQRHWHSDEPGVPSPLGDADKAAVRGALVAATVGQAEFVVRNALVDTVRAVFSHDYPDRWPGLPGELLAQLQSGSPPAVLAAAQLVRVMAKHYEFRGGGDASAPGPAVMLVAAVFPTLVQLGGVLVGHASTEAGAVLTCILKAYFSVAHFRLESHAVLLGQDATLAWMGLLHRVLTRPLAEAPGEQPAGAPVMPAGDDARKAWPWWKARKWAGKVFALWADRWGQPKLLEEGSPAKGAATAFNKAVAPQVAGAVLAQLAEWAGPARRHLTTPVLLYHLKFLQSALGFASCWKPLKPHLPGLLDGVVMRLLALTPAELEAWEHDPQEYLRDESDPFLAHDSPRNAAELLVSQALEDRAADAKPLLDAIVGAALTGYARAFSGPGGSLAPGSGLDAAGAQAVVLRKEAALRLVQGVSQSYRRDKKRRKTIEPLLTAYVLPDLGCPHAPLRARACSLWATFADLKWADPACMQAATRGVLACLRDPSDIVRVTAAAALQSFLDKSELAREVLQPHVGAVLDALFGLLEELGQDEVLATLSSLVEAYSDHMGELAGPILGKLLALWQSTLAEAGVATDATGGFVAPAGGAGAGGDDDDAGDGVPMLEDDAAMTADGVLSAVVTLLMVLRSEGKSDVLLGLAPQLWRFGWGLLDPRGGVVLEFLDSAFAIVGDLVETVGEAGQLEACDAAWATWARMLACYRECAMDYLEHMDLVVEAFFAYGMRRLTAPGPDPAHGRPNLDLWLETVEHTEALADEDTRERMARLVLSLLHGATPTQAVPPPALARLVVAYAAASKNAHTRKLAVAASNVLAQALCYNAPATLAALEAAGATATAFQGWFASLPRHRRSLSAKISILGLTTLLRQPLDALPAVVKANLAAALRGIVYLQTVYEGALVKEKAAREEYEEEEREWGESPDDDDDAGGGEGAGAVTAGGTRMVPAPADDDDGDDAEFGDDDDVVDEEEEKYVREQAERKARRAAGLGGDDDSDDGDSDAESLADQPPPEETPLDHISHLLHVEEALAALGRAGPAAAEVQRALTPDVVQALGALAAKAGELRAAGKQPGAFGPAPEDGAAGAAGR